MIMCNLIKITKIMGPKSNISHITNHTVWQMEKASLHLKGGPSDPTRRRPTSAWLATRRQLWKTETNFLSMMIMRSLISAQWWSTPNIAGFSILRKLIEICLSRSTRKGPWQRRLHTTSSTLKVTIRESTISILGGIITKEDTNL